MSNLETYLHEKPLYEGCMVIMKVADFYETYNEDAIDLAQICGTTLTSRIDHTITGFPKQMLDLNMRKLKRAGFTVIII